MEAISGKAEAILDAAESRARRYGYQGFSFRDLASDVGIKSASVHYHFANKERLAAALTRRYSDTFQASLGDPETAGPTPAARLAHYIALYRKSLVEDDAMCLCGLFGAEIEALPAAARDEVQRFFDINIEWLTAAFATFGDPTGVAPRDRALRILAALEGALILARAKSDVAAFDSIAAGLLAEVERERG